MVDLGETWALSELARTTGGLVLKCSPPPGYTGAEWDWYDELPRRVRKRLAGAGYLSTAGEQPDVLGDWILKAGVPGVHTSEEAVDWYLQAAEEAIRESRAIRWKRRYAARNARAVAAGFGSYWYLRQYRKELGESAQY